MFLSFSVPPPPPSPWTTRLICVKTLQYVCKLADNLNAEIVQGTVQSVADAAQWLGYTYLYVRMLQNPGVYSVPPDELDKDPVLLQFRVDLVRCCCCCCCWCCGW